MRLSRKRNPANGRSTHATASRTQIAITTATGATVAISHQGVRRRAGRP
jgi:hypothetical protein